MSSESRLYFSFLPSLKYIALARVSALLWGQNTVSHLLSGLCYDNLRVEAEEQNDWERIWKEVTHNAESLNIPRTLIDEVSEFVTGMGLEIIHWSDFHLNNHNFIENLPPKFYWKTRGTIDKKKMAEIMVKDESLDITKRYELACIYCLESSVSEMWSRLCECRLCETVIKNLEVDEENLVSLWTHRINDERSFLDDEQTLFDASDKHGFEISVYSGNEVGTRYFLEKLSPDAKDNILWMTGECLGVIPGDRSPTDFPEMYYTDVLCCLLSSITAPDQWKFMEFFGFLVLVRMLRWPWQHVCCRTIERLKEGLSPLSHVDLTRDVYFAEKSLKLLTTAESPDEVLQELDFLESSM